MIKFSFFLLFNFSALSVMASSPKEVRFDHVGKPCPWCQKTIDAVDIILVCLPKEKIKKLEPVISHHVPLESHWVGPKLLCPLGGRIVTHCYEVGNIELHKKMIENSHYIKSLHATWVGEKCPNSACGNSLVDRVEYLGAHFGERDVDCDAVFLVHDKVKPVISLASAAAASGLTPK